MFSVLGHLSLLVNHHLQPPRYGGRQLLEVVPGHVLQPHLLDRLHQLGDGGVVLLQLPVVLYLLVRKKKIMSFIHLQIQRFIKYSKYQRHVKL